MRLADILSMIGSVLVVAGVLALTYYASRWYAKRMGPVHGQGRHIRVVDRASLGQGSAVYIVKAGEKYYLLGAGDKNVSMLSELEGFIEPPQPGADTAVPFRQLFGSIIEKVKNPGNKADGDADEK